MALVKFAAPHDARPSERRPMSCACVRVRAIGEPCRRWRYLATPCLGDVGFFVSSAAFEATLLEPLASTAAFVLEGDGGVAVPD